MTPSALTDALLAAAQIATQGAAQFGAVALIGGAWSLAVLGPRLASDRRWRWRLKVLTATAWALLATGSLASIPLTIHLVLGRSDMALVRSFLTGTAQGAAVAQRCLLATVVAGLTLLALWLVARSGMRERKVQASYATERGPTRAVSVARVTAGLALLASVALVDTLSRLSHAAVMSGASYRALDIVHLSVAGAWGGGLLALALWPWRSAAGGSDTRPGAPSAAATALRRHSLTGMLAVIVLSASGALSALAQVPAVATLVTTEYGLALSAKLALVAATLLAAAYNRWRLLPRLRGHAIGSSLATGLRLEALLLLAVLLATAVLTTRPVPHLM